MLKEGGAQEDQRISYGFRLLNSRIPRPEEAKVLSAVLHRFQERYHADPGAASKLLGYGKSARDESLSSSEVASYAAVANLILNLDETVTRQ